MVVRRKGKKRKFRGHRTYGYGKHKRARGAGTRGGRGKAGMHKHKWTYTVKYAPEHFGKKGFKPPSRKEKNEINLKQIELMLKRWEEEGMVEKEGDKLKINLSRLGFDKVLGSGKLTKPLIVEAKEFSKKAVQKIEAIGGKAIKI